MNLVVPMKIGPMGPKSTRKKIKVKSTYTISGDVKKDADVLKLTCNP